MSLSNYARYKPENRLQFLESSRFFDQASGRENDHIGFRKTKIVAPRKFNSKQKLLTAEEWFSLPDFVCPEEG